MIGPPRDEELRENTGDQKLNPEVFEKMQKRAKEAEKVQAVTYKIRTMREGSRDPMKMFQGGNSAQLCQMNRLSQMRTEKSCDYIIQGRGRSDFHKRDAEGVVL